MMTSKWLMAGVLAFASLNVHASQFIMAKSSDGQPTVVGKLSSENIKQQTMLGKAPKDPALALVSDYYQKGLANDTKSIIDMSFAPDGSKVWMMAEVERYPDKFNGFKKLTGVRATQVYNWGEYDVVAVDWFVEQGRKVGNWYEAVTCPKQTRCKLSNLVINGSKSSELFSIAAQKVQAEPLTKPVVMAHSINLYPNYGKQLNPLEFKFNIEWFEKPVVLGNDEYAANAQSGDYAQIHQYLLELQDAKAQKLDRQAAYALINQQVTQYWSNFDPQQTYPVLSLDEAEPVSNYVPMAIIQRLTNLQSYEIYGVLRAEKEHYLIAQGKFYDHQALFILAVDNQNNKLVHKAANDALFNLVYAPAFYRNINRLLVNRGVL